MSYIQNLFTSRDNNAVGNTYVGQQGRIWWNPDTNSMYYSDGTTPGGIAIGAGGNPFNQILNTTSSVTFANVNVTGNITGNANLTNLTVSGNVTFDNTSTVDLGNLTITDQTIAGTVSGRDISLSPEGTGTLRTLNGIGVYQGAYTGVPLFSVSTTGVVSTLMPNASSYLGALEVVGNPTGTTVAPQNYGTMLHITGVATVPARIYSDGVANYSATINRRYNGTSAAPTPVLHDEIIGRFGATPYVDNGGAGEWPDKSTARLDFVATEDQTTTNQGTRLEVYTTSLGNTTPTIVASFNTDNIQFHGNVLPAHNNEFTLGNSTLKWESLHIGPSSIFIEDSTLHTDADITVDNGTLLINGTQKIQIGNMQMTTSGISLVNPTTAANLLVGADTNTGYMEVNMVGIKFKDDTLQTTAAIPLAQKGAALGVVPLNASVKIDPIYLPAGGVVYKGTWNASTNSPSLTDGSGTSGDEYECVVAGTQTFNGVPVAFNVGDFALYNGTIWQRVPGSGSGVTSFNTRSGAVTLQSSDVTNALSVGSITNSYLNSPYWNLSVGYGIGLTGNGNVALGNAITLTNTGVTGAIGGSGVAVSAATGNVTFSIGQPVGTANSVTFLSVTSNTTVAATGNITGGNIATGGRVVAVGNISTNGSFVSPNTVIDGGVTSVGNISGANLIGQNLTAGRVAIVGAGKQVADDADFTYNATTNVLTVAGNVNANYFNGNVVTTGNITTTANVIGAYGVFSSGNTVINAGISTTGNVTGNYHIGNGSQLTGVITSITPTALSSTVHVAAVTTGTVANIISDATTAATANTIVVRDQYGGINVGSWSINARTVAVNTTLTTTDYWLGLTNKGLTITLPNAANGAVQGRQYLVVDCVQSGSPGDNIITEAGATVVGGSLSQQGQSKTCVFIASTNTWYCN